MEFTKVEFPYSQDFDGLVCRFNQLASPVRSEDVIEFMDHYFRVYATLPPDGRAYADWMIDLVGKYGKPTPCGVPNRLWKKIDNVRSS